MKNLFILCLGLFLFSCNQEPTNNVNEGNPDGYLAQSIENGFPTVGLQILEAREKKGISADELAKAIGLSDQNVKSIETNRVVPTRDIIVSIQKVLDTEIILDAH